MSRSKLAPDWLHEGEQPIESQVSKLTQLLTMTTSHKFPAQVDEDEEVAWECVAEGGYPEPVLTLAEEMDTIRTHSQVGLFLTNYKNC